MHARIAPLVLLVALAGCHGDKVGDYADATAGDDADAGARDSGLDAPVDSRIDGADVALDSGHDTAGSDSSPDSADSASEAAVDTAVDPDADATLVDTTVADGPADVTPADGAPVDSGPNCGVHPGPRMIDLGDPARICIDSTEVTVAQYAAFVAGTKTSSAGCLGHDYRPTAGVPTDADAPATGVDWCDAFDYCRWAGKRLCGSFAGGAVAPGSVFDPAVDEWFYACQNGAAKLAYPYGVSYVSGACVDDSATGPSLVGSRASCRGASPPYDALLDMSGNVAEWEDACDASMVSCQLRGGYYSSPAADLACGGNNSVPPTLRNNEIGFRCCSN